MRSLRLVIVLTGLWGAFWLQPSRGHSSEALTVTSPDGSILVSFQIKANPQPYLPEERAYYRVAYRGTSVLRDSPLGLDFMGSTALDRSFEILESRRTSIDDSWDNPFGAERKVSDHYNELQVFLQERQAPHRRLHVCFRVFNEGLAFRYFLPEQAELKNFILSSENTGFYFAGAARAYQSTSSRNLNAYETQFREVDVNEIKPTAMSVMPMLIHLSHGPWMAILEADLDDYAGAYLGGVLGVPNALVTRLSPRPDRFYESQWHMTYFTTDEAVIGSTPKASPWRVILINDKPGGLIESSSLILNLNPPSRISDESWIEPGKSAWADWSNNFAANVDFKPGMNTATMNHYIEFAAAHHLEYFIVDGGWYQDEDILKSIPEINLPEILAHAKERGVKIILWIHWEPTQKQMDTAFPIYEKWGVSGVKVDFMNRDDQEMVNFYHRVVSTAAKYHLVIDLHGAYKPTGLRRTYPNLLTREAVMGMEYSTGTDFASPEHDATLPFTRMLAGPMDYTPGCFNNATRAQFIPRVEYPMCQGTRAHQLALYVVFFSPLQMLADYPESFDSKPGMEFLEKVPTVWDETRVLSGEPAHFVAIARRNGAAWYLGAITDWDARDLELPLGFLGSGEFTARIFADGPHPDVDATSISITTQQASSADPLRVHLAPGGGVAVILMPTK